MSIEKQHEKSGTEVSITEKDLMDVRSLVSENPLLERDEYTREMLDNKFIMDGKQLDPGNWIADRLEFLKKQEESGETNLADRIKEDFDMRRPD